MWAWRVGSRWIKILSAQYAAKTCKDAVEFANRSHQIKRLRSRQFLIGLRSRVLSPIWVKACRGGGRRRQPRGQESRPHCQISMFFPDSLQLFGQWTMVAGYLPAQVYWQISFLCSYHALSTLFCVDYWLAHNAAQNITEVFEGSKSIWVGHCFHVICDQLLNCLYMSSCFMPCNNISGKLSQTGCIRINFSGKNSLQAPVHGPRPAKLASNQQVLLLCHV